MRPEIMAYIEYRFPNWHDYAAYHARVNGFSDYADDLLNDIILDLLNKPEDKINTMFSKKTKKIVNNLPTTDLDRFVLRMIKVNAVSKTAPFRKNTLGRKIISRKNSEITTISNCSIERIDVEVDCYDMELDQKLTRMHEFNINRLIKNKFNSNTINDYYRFFIRGHAPASDQETERHTQLFKFLTTRKTLLDD